MYVCMQGRLKATSRLATPEPPLAPRPLLALSEVDNANNNVNNDSNSKIMMVIVAIVIP